MISFFVPGCPVAQPRGRVLVAGGKVQHVGTPKGARVVAFKAAVKLYARQAVGRAPPLAGPLWAYLLFLMPRARRSKHSGRRWHAHAPDVDNLAKSMLDACKGILYADDAQVCYLECAKRVAAAGESPGVSVRIVQAEE